MCLGGTFGFVLDNMFGSDEGFREYRWSSTDGMKYTTLALRSSVHPSHVACARARARACTLYVVMTMYTMRVWRVQVRDRRARDVALRPLRHHDHLRHVLHRHPVQAAVHARQSPSASYRAQNPVQSQCASVHTAQAAAPRVVHRYSRLSKLSGFTDKGREWLANGFVSTFISVVTYQVYANMVRFGATCTTRGARCANPGAFRAQCTTDIRCIVRACCIPVASRLQVRFEWAYPSGTEDHLNQCISEPHTVHRSQCIRCIPCTAPSCIRSIQCAAQAAATCVPRRWISGSTMVLASATRGAHRSQCIQRPTDIGCALRVRHRCSPP